MKVKIFSIYDVKAQAFNQPFFSNNRGTAIRSFAEAISDKNSMYGKYPEDFVLFEIGVFDDESCGIDCLSSPQNCGNALEFVTTTN